MPDLRQGRRITSKDSRAPFPAPLGRVAGFPVAEQLHSLGQTRHGKDEPLHWLRSHDPSRQHPAPSRIHADPSRQGPDPSRRHRPAPRGQPTEIYRAQPCHPSRDWSHRLAPRRPEMHRGTTASPAAAQIARIDETPSGTRACHLAGRVRPASIRVTGEASARHAPNSNGPPAACRVARGTK